MWVRSKARNSKYDESSVDGLAGDRISIAFETVDKPMFPTVARICTVTPLSSKVL